MEEHASCTNPTFCECECAACRKAYACAGRPAPPSGHERYDVHTVEVAWSHEDRPLPEDAAIIAAHPLETKRFDLYTEAVRLVGAKHSKYALVNLVNWLLAERAKVVEASRSLSSSLEASGPNLAHRTSEDTVEHLLALREVLRKG